MMKINMARVNRTVKSLIHRVLDSSIIKSTHKYLQGFHEAPRDHENSQLGIIRLGIMLYNRPLRLHRIITTYGLLLHYTDWRQRLNAWRDNSLIKSLLIRGIALVILFFIVEVICIMTSTVTLIISSMLIGIATGSCFGAIRGSAIGITQIIFTSALTSTLLTLSAGITGNVNSTEYFPNWLLCLFITSVSLSRLYAYPHQFLVSALLSWLGRVAPSQRDWVLSWLPYRRSDLIYLPLPGIRALVTELGKSKYEEEQKIAFDLLVDAVGSVGQKEVAIESYADLQCYYLVQALISNDEMQKVKDGTLPFFPNGNVSSGDSELQIFKRVAWNLVAAERAENQHLREKLLLEAEQILSNAVTNDLTQSRFLDIAIQWREIVQKKKHQLAADKKDNPQLPLVFQAGDALRWEDRFLFKGRKDLARTIEQDLASERVTIYLWGQRRMGKSSLINMLPELLGTNTQVVVVNFQGLSGSDLRDVPFCEVARHVAIARKLRQLGRHKHWGRVMEWLSARDAELAQEQRRMLIAIDEIERIEDGTRDGWCSLDFLDFVRAAGDGLRNIRFLLTSAYLPERLGRSWTDKLINAQRRDLGYFDIATAQELLLQPLPQYSDLFSKVYPSGGVENIISQTAGHPYFLQLVGYLLCARLNKHQKLTATDDDIKAALDESLSAGDMVLSELWQSRTVDEQAVLMHIVRGEPPAPELARQQLTREGYLSRTEHGWRITVPLFERWLSQRLEM